MPFRIPVLLPGLLFAFAVLALRAAEPANTDAAEPAKTEAAGAVAGGRVPGTAGGDVDLSTYTLRPGDQMYYRVEEDPKEGDTPLIVSVNPLGDVSFPVSRGFDLRITFPARSNTLEQVRTEITRRLLEAYYNKATVGLTLVEKMIVQGKVQFFGKGGVKGEFALSADGPPVKLSDAILRLNPPDSANLRKVKIRRVDPATGKVRLIDVDVQAIIKENRRELDVVLQDGDRIEVPEKWIN